MISLDSNAIASRGRDLTANEFERLDMLCDGFAGAGLSLVGRRVVQNELVSAVQPIPSGRFEASKLVVIVGLPRAGTTLLHHLMSARSEAWTLPLWAAKSPGSGPDGGRAAANDYVRLIDAVQPLVRQLHPLHVDGPEECSTARQATLMSERFWYLGASEEYLRAVERSPEQVWSSWFKLLGGLAPKNRPVILKDPSHLGRWQELPEMGCTVHVVRVWRDPLEVAHSFSRLIAALRTITMESVRADKVFGEVSRYLSRRIELELELPQPSDVDLIDLSYSELAAAPTRTADAVLRRCGVAPRAAGPEQKLLPSPPPEEVAWPEVDSRTAAILARAIDEWGAR